MQAATPAPRSIPDPGKGGALGADAAREYLTAIAAGLVASAIAVWLAYRSGAL